MVEQLESLPVENVFLDNVEMTVDGKLRVGIPERFMKVLKSICPGDTDKIGIIPSTDHSLRLLPYPDFLKRVEWWKTLNEQISTHRTIKNLETSLAKVLPLDHQNRMRLTPQQAKFARINNRAVIVGKIQCMQLYDPSVFDSMIERELENFAQAGDAVAREAPAPGA